MPSMSEIGANHIEPGQQVILDDRSYHTGVCLEDHRLLID